MQNSDCVFCKIVASEIPANKIYEDESVLAFMDIRPITRGHVLVIPKKHTEDLLSTDDDTLKDLMPKVKQITAATMQAVHADGITVSTNHGAAAGQTVFHLHFHIIPRFNKDGLKSWQHHDSDSKTREEIADAIKKNL